METKKTSELVSPSTPSSVQRPCQRVPSLPEHRTVRTDLKRLEQSGRAREVAADTLERTGRAWVGQASDTTSQYRRLTPTNLGLVRPYTSSTDPIVHAIICLFWFPYALATGLWVACPRQCVSPLSVSQQSYSSIQRSGRDMTEMEVRERHDQDPHHEKQ